MVKNIKKKELCIVHIGMHKTGSSSIQNFLYNDLNGSEYNYADLKVENQSKVIYSLFSKNPYEYHGHKDAGLTKEEVNEYNQKNEELLKECFLSDCAEKIIISGESILYLKQDELLKLKTYLELYFLKVKIIAYVRPLLSYVESAFQELVRHGLNKIDFTFADPSYEKFTLFYDVFGGDNVTLKAFHKSMLYRNDVLQDFCKTLGIDVNIQKNIINNESLSKEAVSLLYVYQKYTKNFYTPGINYNKERNLLISTIKSIGNTKLTFSRNFVQEIIDKNLHVIPAIERKLDFKIIEDRNDFDASVTSEDDLLEFNEETINELYGLLSQYNINYKKNNLDAKNVAILVDKLNKKINESVS